MSLKITNNTTNSDGMDLLLKNIKIKEDHIQAIADEHIKNLTVENCRMNEDQYDFLTSGIVDTVKFTDCVVNNEKMMNLRLEKHNGEMVTPFSSRASFDLIESLNMPFTESPKEVEGDPKLSKYMEFAKKLRGYAQSHYDALGDFAASLGNVGPDKNTIEAQKVKFSKILTEFDKLLHCYALDGHVDTKDCQKQIQMIVDELNHIQNTLWLAAPKKHKETHLDVMALSKFLVTNDMEEFIAEEPLSPTCAEAIPEDSTTDA
jgi:hypothetical protein